MIRYWLTSTILGTGLGLVLYACVRMRMHYGPILRERYGNWLRQTYWILTILFMVAMANLGLLFLRTYLPGAMNPTHSLMLEIWFALLAMGLAMTLILRQLKKDSCDTTEE
jgi:hypothetical protein